MKKTFTLLLILISVSVFLLQSCTKGHPIIGDPVGEDKLLLSKVTGTNIPIAWNFFEFSRDSLASIDHLWHYSATYSYGSNHQAWDDYKALTQVSFLNGGSYFYPPSAGGSWDITYNNSLPDKIIDNSIPGVDQGYWKLYYNDKFQVIKTGFAFSTSAGPTEFEFYGYDDHNNLTDLVYGKYVDTPFYKLTFAYDNQGNLTEWQMLFPNGYTNSATSATMNAFSSVANLPRAKGLMSSPVIQAIKRLAINLNDRKQNLSVTGMSLKIPPTRLIGDSDVIYQNYITSTITNDGKINPYHQQGRLLFYISSRNYSADITANFSQLQKSNPVSIQYVANPDFGVLDPMTSNFTYTYNKLGYPITTHEETADPDGIWIGLNYTQDRQIEYIKN